METQIYAVILEPNGMIRTLDHAPIRSEMIGILETTEIDSAIVSDQVLGDQTGALFGHDPANAFNENGSHFVEQPVTGSVLLLNSHRSAFSPVQVMGLVSFILSPRRVAA